MDQGALVVVTCCHAFFRRCLMQKPLRPIAYQHMQPTWSAFRSSMGGRSRSGRRRNKPLREPSKWQVPENVLEQYMAGMGRKAVVHISHVPSHQRDVVAVMKCLPRAVTFLSRTYQPATVRFRPSSNVADDEIVDPIRTMPEPVQSRSLKGWHSWCARGTSTINPREVR